MKFYILPLLIFMLTLFTPVETLSAAANLEISNTSDFTAPSTNFSGGQVIFVRLESSLPSTANSKLNLRDNEYSLVNSFQFKKDGGYFSAVIPVPHEAGYYSLEGIIEKDDSNTTSVATIRVGNPANASVRVNVDSSTGGSEVLGESGGVDISSDPTSSPDNIEVYRAENEEEVAVVEQNKGIGYYFSSIVREIVDFLWPF